MIVYDYNWPGEKHSVLLKKENGKYTGWEYTLWSGTTWGTGRKWAKLIAYDPSEDFVSQFEKVVGYTRAASEKSKLFISVDNENSSIVKNDNKVKLSMDDTDDNKYEVTYNTVKQDDEVKQFTISGTNAEQFEGNQTKEGIVIESDSLENVQVDLREVDINGEVEPLVTKNISTDSNRILINNNEEKLEFTIKEESNGDGKFDKNLVSVSLK